MISWRPRAWPSERSPTPSTCRRGNSASTTRTATCCSLGSSRRQAEELVRPTASGPTLIIGCVLLRRALCAFALSSCLTSLAVPTAGAAPTLADRTFRLGSIYKITGHTGIAAGARDHTRGRVTLRGSWNGGPWRVIDRTRTQGPTGFYRLVVRPGRRGVLRLRLTTPDPATFNVVLTVI